VGGPQDAADGISRPAAGVVGGHDDGHGHGGKGSGREFVHSFVTFSPCAPCWVTIWFGVAVARAVVRRSRVVDRWGVAG
jgi:hypothetical protein